MKYKTMNDWLSEIENYGTRMERFLEEWDAGMNEKRMLQWFQAAWDCARMESDETEESEIDIERSFK